MQLAALSTNLNGASECHPVCATAGKVAGAMGIAAGMILSRLINSLAQWPTFTPALWMGIASLSSAMIGLISGFYPAWKASQLDPIGALRYE